MHTISAVYIWKNVFIYLRMWKCCVIRSLDEKLLQRNRTWEFYHLFGAPLAQLCKEVARILHSAFPIYKALRTSPLCCKAHSVKLCEYFVMNNSFARFWLFVYILLFNGKVLISVLCARANHALELMGVSFAMGRAWILWFGPVWTKGAQKDEIPMKEKRLTLHWKCALVWYISEQDA